MTRDGAAEPVTPNSRTGDTTVDSPSTPAMTPAKTPLSMDHNAAESHKVISIAGTPRNGSLKAEGRTRREQKGPVLGESHGQPVKKQERVSYHNMIVRYGDWSNVRHQVLAYFLLTLVICIYRGHNVEIYEMTNFPRVRDSRHIHCPCTASDEQLELSRIRREFDMNGIMSTMVFVVLLLIGVLSPLWERFIGRRRILYGIMAAAIPSSAIFMSQNVSTIHQISLAILILCSMMILLINMINLIEMLPYETRYFAVYSYTFCESVTTAFSIIHFHYGFEIFNMGLCLVFTNLIGIIILRFLVKDSICHLNICNDVQSIEKIVQKEEYRLHVKKREGNRRFHEAIAKKIFEDLVYLDQDELKLSEFFNQLYKNTAVIEIVLGFFQSISSGMHEYEATRFTNERLQTPYRLTVDRLLGSAFSGVLMYFLRKAHRNRVLCLLFTAALLNLIVRNALIDYDEYNRCAEIGFILGSFAIEFGIRYRRLFISHTLYADKFNGLSQVLSIFGSMLSFCISTTILLHYLETAPSILRATCIIVIYMPMKVTEDLMGNFFSQHAYKDLRVLAPVYAYHLLIIILTLLRTRSRLPFSLYLFDLMLQSDGERGTNRSDNEKSNNYTERTARNLSAEKDKAEIKDQKPEEKQSTIEEQRKKYSKE